MFQGKSLWQIFSMGGFTMYILLFCSVLSLAVIFERLYSYFKKSFLNKIEFMNIIRAELEKKDIAKAIKLCELNYSPISAVVLAGLKMHGHDEKAIISAMEREIMVETVKLEKYTSIVGTIGNIAVYIGLFGTVLGIIRSFHDISTLGSGHISIVIGGVAEALTCTATGLLVAIPAVVAYNYFVKRVDNFITDMEYCASQTADLLISRKYNETSD
ncbi:MAG: MotA/TolQ/ExbB proton channel family protein [Elusimicrobia bacterium]|nr:MotA/TolQ/ExbB proton channel family protein [Candidatus Liberimonas magnetica]